MPCCLLLPNNGNKDRRTGFLSGSSSGYLLLRTGCRPSNETALYLRSRSPESPVLSLLSKSERRDFVAECIGERIREMIRFLFFYMDDSPVDAFVKTEAVTWFYEAAHIKGATLFPFLIIDIAVQVTGLVESKAVQVAMVDDLAVLAEGNILHSVDICRIIHIIVGFDRQPDFSPSFDLTGDGLFAVFGP